MVWRIPIVSKVLVLENSTVRRVLQYSQVHVFYYVGDEESIWESALVELLSSKVQMS